MAESIIVYKLPELRPAMLREFSGELRVEEQSHLLSAASSGEAGAVVLDLDDGDAFGTIAAIHARQPDLPVVGVTAQNEAGYVIRALQCGCAQVTGRPIQAQDLRIALHHAMGNHAAAGRRCQTFAVMGAGGGLGCTTVACHLGIEIAALTETRTALFELDLDLGTMASAFDLPAKHSIADLLEMSQHDSVLFEGTSHSVTENLEVFVRPDDVGAASAITAEEISRMLGVAQSVYSNMVIDLPPRFSPVAGAAIELCDKVLVVLQLTVPSLQNAERIIGILTEGGVPDARIAVVVNRKGRGSQDCDVREVRNLLGRDPVAIIPSDYRAVRDANDKGRILPAGHPVRNAIGGLARDLLGDLAAGRKKGWIRSLLGSGT